MNVLILSDPSLRRRGLDVPLYHALSDEGIRAWIDWPLDLTDYRAQMLSMMNEADLVVFLLGCQEVLANALKTEWSAAHLSQTRKLVVCLGGATVPSPNSTFTHVTCTEADTVAPTVRDFILHGLKLSIFISYARKDRHAALTAVRLARLSLSPTWIDESGLSPGKPFPDALESAIEAASRFLLLWSANAAQSPWVEREWQFALAKNRLIAPLLLDETPLPPALQYVHGFKTLGDVALLDWLAIPDSTRASIPFRAWRWWTRIRTRRVDA